MKKYFYLLALVCTLGFFTACSSDDDDDKKQEEVSALVGTWNVEPTVEKEEGLYDGSVRINWEGEAGTSISMDMGDGEIYPMDLKTIALPLAANWANTKLPKVLKDVTFTQDGSSVWKMCVRTLENCMMETYMDCPYYEQMQFPMDGQQLPAVMLKHTKIPACERVIWNNCQNGINQNPRPSV